MCVREREQLVGGGAEKRAGYMQALLNFNFRKVSFSSRSDIKIIFKGRGAEKECCSDGLLRI